MTSTELKVGRVATETQQARVYRELRDALLAGRFVPGESITIRSLTEAMGTGTMPVREAVQRLVAKGALEFFPNRTVRVPEFDLEGFRELCEIRVALEGMAASRAASYIEPAVVDELDAQRVRLEKLAQGRDAEAALTANLDFHFQIYRAGRSVHLMPIIETLWLRMGPLLVIPFRAGRTARKRFLEHRSRNNELLQALRDRKRGVARKVLAAIINDSVAWYEQHYDFESHRLRDAP
jgi:DNA-binding GntR family transcriptional regulator